MALALIFFLYIGIGVLAAIGTIALSSRWPSPKVEQIFYGLLLAPIGGVYLIFSAYFNAEHALPTEALAVFVFTVLGLLGIRLPLALILGYALHGAWDLLHELYTHAGFDVGGFDTLTGIPLAYGVFCAAYDWSVAAYFILRRRHWKAAWRPPEM